jgi:hypothetical protein
VGYDVDIAAIAFDALPIRAYSGRPFASKDKKTAI